MSFSIILNALQVDGWVGIINLYVPVKFNNVFITLSSIYMQYSKKEYNLFMAWLKYLDVFFFFGSTILFWLLDIINSMFAEINQFHRTTFEGTKMPVCLPVYKLHVWYPQRFVWTEELECINWHWTEIVALIKKNQLHQVISSQHRLTSWYV